MMLGEYKGALADVEACLRDKAVTPAEKEQVRTAQRND